MKGPYNGAERKGEGPCPERCAPGRKHVSYPLPRTLLQVAGLRVSWAPAPSSSSCLNRGWGEAAVLGGTVSRVPCPTPRQRTHQSPNPRACVPDRLGSRVFADDPWGGPDPLRLGP